MEVKQMKKNVKKIVLLLYTVISFIVYFGAGFKLGFDSIKSQRMLVVFVVFILISCVLAKIEALSEVKQGIIFCAIITVTIVYVALFWHDSKYLHIGLMMLSAMMSFYESPTIIKHLFRFSIIAYILVTVISAIQGEPRGTIMVNLLTGVVVLGDIMIVMYMIERNSRLYKIIRENSMSSQDMLKVVQMKREEAENATKTKSLFLSNMSHEIRTPLNAILGMDEMITRESNESNIIEYAERIKNAGNTLLSLINDILDFSKIEAGKMEIIKEKYKFVDVLDGVYQMINIKAESKGLKLSFDIAKDIPSELFGDSLRVKQIILNIMNNAVKYTDKGHISLSIDWQPEKEDKIKLYIAVADTGIGIKEENLKKLFTSFDRIEESHTKYVEGTGLGMSITQNLLDLMGGTIRVESKYGEGSTFYVSLIQDVISYKGIGKYDARRNFVNDSVRYKESLVAPDAKVLVVDDNELNLMVIKGLLKKSKLNITTAMSGKQAIELVKANRFDIIFMDHMMPEMDGIETFDAMKIMDDNLCMHAPVIALTANAVTGSREMYLTHGFTDYLSKPVDGKKLEKMLIDYLPRGKFEVSEKETTNSETVRETVDLDTKVGIKYAGGEEQYKEVLRLFVDTSKQKGKVLENCYLAEDWKTYTIEVHAIKSSAKYVGAESLSEIAEEQEKFGKIFDGEGIKSTWSEFVDIWIRALKKAREYLRMDEGNSPVKENKDNGVVLGKYEYDMYVEEIIANINMFEADIVDQILSDLLEYKLSDEVRDKLTEAKEEIDRFNYSGALEMLK